MQNKGKIITYFFFLPMRLAESLKDSNIPGYWGCHPQTLVQYQMLQIGGSHLEMCIKIQNMHTSELVLHWDSALLN